MDKLKLAKKLLKAAKLLLSRWSYNFETIDQAPSDSFVVVDQVPEQKALSPTKKSKKKLKWKTPSRPGGPSVNDSMTSTSPSWTNRRVDIPDNLRVPEIQDIVKEKRRGYR